MPAMEGTIGGIPVSKLSEVQVAGVAELQRITANAEKVLLENPGLLQEIGKKGLARPWT